MSYLHADRQIIVELITVRTTAFVTANRIDAAIVTAWRRVAFILIYTLIIIKVLHKAFGTSTAVAAHKILESYKDLLKLVFEKKVFFFRKERSINNGGLLL